MEDSRGIGAGAPPGLASQYRYMLRTLHEMRQRQLHTAQSTLTETLDPGEDIVTIAVSYEAGLADGRLALHSGHTEVVSVPCAPRDAVTAVYEANREAALSLRLLAQDNDAGWRSLSGGLAADEVALPQDGRP